MTRQDGVNGARLRNAMMNECDITNAVFGPNVDFGEYPYLRVIPSLWGGEEV